MKTNDFSVEVLDENKRLDVYLTQLFPDKSRSFIHQLIKKENVFVNDTNRNPNYKVKKNDKIRVVIPAATKLDVEAEDIPIDIIYEDKDVLVVNKPQGMVVHPAAGIQTGTLVNAILNHCTDLSGINGVLRPGIVHRIDKDTSGVLVIAKNDLAHNRLAEQLENHSMNREYVAITEGIIKVEEGTIDAPLARDPKERIKIAVVKDGRHAVTHFKVIERFKANTLIVCKLETGRTHQIRVHMAHIGHPIVGDPVYGYKKQRFRLTGQMLHARTLGFIHPTTKKYVEFNADLPEYFTRILGILRNELKNI